MLSLKQLHNVCLLHGGANGLFSEQCQYLKQDATDWQKWHCTKQRPKEKRKIDSAVRKFLADCRKNGIDPRKQNVPLGDYCKGYPVLKHKEQGYDKP